MLVEEKTVSVPEAASLIGITRSTVNHWIKTGKLHAQRLGRNYAVPVKELLLFLKSTGRRIPPELESENSGPSFRVYRHCWSCWAEKSHGLRCDGCIVHTNRIEICFAAKDSSRLHCTTMCYECAYYQDIYLPRIQFVHQVRVPAAVCRGLYFWGVSNLWSQLCQVPLKDFPGAGIESAFAQESLEAAITSVRELELGEPVQSIEGIHLKTKHGGRLAVAVSPYPLDEPSGTFLLLARPEDYQSQKPTASLTQQRRRKEHGGIVRNDRPGSESDVRQGR